MKVKPGNLSETVVRVLNMSIVLALEEEPQVCQVCEVVLLVEVSMVVLVEALVKVLKEELV